MSEVKVGVRWSKEELDFLTENFVKLEYDDIASALNRTRRDVQRQASKMKLTQRFQYEFAVYQGDKFEFIGTAQECSDYMGIKIDSFRSYVHRSREYIEDTTRTTPYEGILVIEMGRWEQLS